MMMSSRKAVWIRRVSTVAAVISTAVVLSPVQAQDMINRLQRMQNELTTLQQHVYQGKAPSAASRAAIPAGAAPNAATARLSNRITQLVSEIRRLTGTNEELNHKVSELQTRLDKMSTDLEFRLKTLEVGARPAGSEGQAPVAGADTPPALAGVRSPQTVRDLRGAARGVRPFGSKTPLSPKAEGQVAAVPPAAQETPEQQYDRAHSLIVKKRDFMAAERVLTYFIGANRKHRLAPNAHYWLGRTYFVRSNFEQAAISFAEGFQRYPESRKAPATLLNLGMSLSKLGKNREACTTYTRLARNFRKMESSVKRRLASERKRSKCRR
jgi:tol-pal system protein YbgF